MTKQEVLEKCRSILYSNPTNFPLKQDDFNFLMSIFPLHPEWNEKKNGHKVIAIVPRKHPTYGNLCFALWLDDGNKVDISFTECVNRAGLRESIKEACLGAIKDLTPNTKKINSIIRDWVKTFDLQDLSVGVYVITGPFGTNFNNTEITESFRNYYLSNVTTC